MMSPVIDKLKNLWNCLIYFCRRYDDTLYIVMICFKRSFSLFTRRCNSMSISIAGSSYGQQAYSSINVNSKKYKAAADAYLDAVIAEEAMITPEQKMM